MPCFSISNVRVAGLSVALPAKVESNEELSILTDRERLKLIKMVGIKERRVAPEGMCASDLCVAAAQRLMDKMGWQAEEIDALVFVSQSPDHLVPGTATQIQERLGIPKRAMTLDINQGCAGYVYGLGTIGAIQSVSGFKKTLLLVGDTITQRLSSQDKSTVPIFSDAGSATALEYCTGVQDMHFNLQGTGAGYEAIYVPAGGSRQPFQKESLDIEEDEKGARRADIHLNMNGLDIFNFALTEVAPNVKKLLEFVGEDASTVDYFVFHQANLLLNESIRRKLGIPKEKVPYTLSKYGNTSCATIPVTLADQFGKKLNITSSKMMLTGFGVGLSWGSVLLNVDQMVCMPPIDVE